MELFANIVIEKTFREKLHLSLGSEYFRIVLLYRTLQRKVNTYAKKKIKYWKKGVVSYKSMRKFFLKK